VKIAQDFVFYGFRQRMDKRLKQKLTSIKPTNMATYKIDVAHSEISFKVKHLMITNVTGTFRKFDASKD
jgi:polyisoprenoid-binding protein YceI